MPASSNALTVEKKPSRAYSVSSISPGSGSIPGLWREENRNTVTHLSRHHTSLFFCLLTHRSSSPQLPQTVNHFHCHSAWHRPKQDNLPLCRPSNKRTFLFLSHKQIIITFCITQRSSKESGWFFFLSVYKASTWRNTTARRTPSRYRPVLLCKGCRRG